MSTATVVRGICMRLRIPSCIRAPPAAENTTSGRRVATARSAAATMALPTYMPIEPAMKPKSCTATTTGVRSTSPSATSIASASPEACRAARRRSGYFFWSRKRSGSSMGLGTAISAKVPPSKSAVSRSRGAMCMWWPQLVQTCRFSASSRWNSIVPHSSHLDHRFSGTSRRENSELILGRT